MRVFLYHIAVAIPPASAEAAATIPNHNQPVFLPEGAWDAEEVEESKELVMN
jgi:hypothetical protein